MILTLKKYHATVKKGPNLEKIKLQAKNLYLKRLPKSLKCAVKKLKKCELDFYLF